MKSAANCVTWCELQDTLIIDNSNAYGGPGPRDLGHVRLRVGKSIERESRSMLSHEHKLSRAC
jgi:hypothetical protein